jgi:hypothetical protein
MFELARCECSRTCNASRSTTTPTEGGRDHDPHDELIASRCSELLQDGLVQFFLQGLTMVVVTVILFVDERPARADHACS